MPSPSAFRPDLFAGQRVLVTGGSSGIGLAIARSFVQHGAEVHILGRDPGRLAAAQKAAGAFAVHAADVRDSARIEELAGGLEAGGGIDVLVNAAAGNFPVPFSAMSENAWRTVVDIVLHGTANTCRSFGGRMRGGSILNVVAGYAWTGAPGVSHSGAAKAGVLNLTKSLAVEWAPKVRVNAVSPGPIDGTEGMKRLADDLGLREQLQHSIPLARMGTADEVAQACLFLASPAASYVTGACLVVDGGQDARGPFGGLLTG
ncbi:MAG TPA: SDR family oxidoreductase [Candidatus Thermoplasmatota archaeon]|nr:SDR family oxidoreductase [Candidatus Thermoplasmatota archaeon]